MRRQSIDALATSVDAGIRHLTELAIRCAVVARSLTRCCPAGVLDEARESRVVALWSDARRINPTHHRVTSPGR